MERTGLRQRIVRFWRWQPQTYLQVWLLVLTTFGGAGLIAWAVLRTRVPWLALAPGYAMAVAVFGSTLSWQMYRRRQRGR